MTDRPDLRTPLQRILADKPPSSTVQPYPFNASDQLAAFKETDALAIIREAEKALIRTVYAPLKLSERDKIKKTYSEAIETAAEETKRTVEAIAAQLDSAVKGKFSTQIKTAVKEKAKGYDEI